jgi:hypothetical protein
VLPGGLVVAILIEGEHVGVDGVGASATGSGLWAGGGSSLVASVAFGIGFRDGVEGGLDIFLLGAGASAAMVAATRLCRGSWVRKMPTQTGHGSHRNGGSPVCPSTVGCR